MIEYQHGEEQMAMLVCIQIQNEQGKAAARFKPERQKGPVIDCCPEIPSSKICLLKCNLRDKRAIIH
jgi:hypothetical protein